VIRGTDGDFVLDGVALAIGTIVAGSPDMDEEAG
jgi:hypothetical protein